MNRQQEILQASQEFLKKHFQNDLYAFVEGAKWADANPGIETTSKCERYEAALKYIESNFDHDVDAHRYGTTCRCCMAKQVLAEHRRK